MSPPCITSPIVRAHGVARHWSRHRAGCLRTRTRVEALRDLRCAVLGDEFRERGRHEPTARHTEPFGERVGRGEQVIRKRKSRLHTCRIPRYDHEAQPSPIGKCPPLKPETDSSAPDTHNLLFRCATRGAASCQIWQERPLPRPHTLTDRPGDLPTHTRTCGTDCAGSMTESTARCRIVPRALLRMHS